MLVKKRKVYRSAENLHNSLKRTGTSHHRLQQVKVWLPLSRVCSKIAAHSMASMVHVLPWGEAAPHMQSVPGVFLLWKCWKKAKHQISYLFNHLCKNYHSLNKQITKYKYNAIWLTKAEISTNIKYVSTKISLS